MNRAGRYEICGRLGRGGMSTVYKARAPITGRVVALKILQPRDEIFVDLVGKERLKEIFIEEARIMGAITHAHIARIIDCDDNEDAPFIVLEYFSHSIGGVIGESYKSELPSRPVSVPRTFRYMNQALKGLERLHFAGIIHRDIKPHNLMLTDDDLVKIIDFGLSRVHGEEKMAIPGIHVGSPYYAAPEQESNAEKAEARADLYSVGVVMYRLLTGHLVDPRRIVLPSAYNPDLHAAWDTFLQKALALDPADRFGSAHEMRLALEQVYLDWQTRSEQSCDLLAAMQPREDPLPCSIESKPTRIMYKDVRGRLGLDLLFRPVHSFSHPLVGVNDLVVFDQATGLSWQRRGSEFPLNWREAKEYVHHLNEVEYAGIDNWRLPTAAELVTILRPPTVHRDFCIDPLFAPEIHWLWSSDHCTGKTAWMADIVESYIGLLDLDGSAMVCAVATSLARDLARQG